MTTINKQKIINTAGWTGAIISLSAYTANSSGFIQSKSFAYLLMNALACLMLIFYTFNKRAFVNTTLNSIWLIVTVIAIISAIISGVK